MRFLFLFLISPALLSAQSVNLKDHDVVWAAEIEQDWVVDIPSLEAEWDSGITTIKLLRPGPGWSSPYLANFVYQAALNKKLPVYKDPACTIPVGDITQEYSDTIVTFDPITFEAKVVAVNSEIDADSKFYIKAWRLRQVLAYHKKSATWSATVEAMAPLVIDWSEHLDSIGLRPLFWFKPESRRPKLSSRHMVWAKETVNKQAKTRLPAQFPNPLKVTAGFQNPLEHLFLLLGTKKNISFYKTLNDKALSFEERKSLVQRSDTTFSIYPGTNEEEVTIEQKGIKPSDIRELRLVQTWYWDDRRHRLFICLDAVAPLKDPAGRFSAYYQEPAFYRRAKH